MNEGKVASIILLIIGIGLIFGTAYFIFDTIDFLEKSHKVTGIITDINVAIGEEGNEYEEATIVFYDSDSVSHKIRDGLNFYDMRIGGSVDVRYLPGQAEFARISKNWFDDWFVCMALGIFGTFFLVGGYIAAKYSFNT